MTFIEDTTQIAFDPISNLYHANGTSAADQHTLTLLWQATQGMFNEFDVAATLLLSTGLIVLGVAMFRAPTFGKVFGGLSMAIGVAQILGITFLSTNSAAYAPFAPSRLPRFPYRIRVEGLSSVKGAEHRILSVGAGDNLPSFFY